MPVHNKEAEQYGKNLKPKRDAETEDNFIEYDQDDKER